MRRTGLVFLAVLALAPAARAATPLLPSTGVVMTDYGVDSIRHFGDQLLLLGAFEHIGAYVGSGLGVDPASGAIDPAFPRFDGQVSDAIEDGHGGWFVGGQFLIGGARPTHHLVHLLPSGALDPGFKDNAGDFVTALALAGGRLYATRWFKGGVRAFDAATGDRVPSFAQSQPDEASELDVAGGRLYVGGSDGVFALDPGTGDKIAAFACAPCASGQVSALAHDDTRLYVGERGGRLFAVNLSTGARDSAFAPQPGRPDADYYEDDGPLVLAVDGSRLLVGGRNLNLGGPSRTLVALDRSTGAADPAFATGLRQPVDDMVLRGDAIVASGARFDGISPQLVTLDAASGAVRATVDTSLDGPVDALAGTGARLFVGGRFNTRGNVETAGAALVDARTGALVPGFSVRSFSWDQYAPNVVVTDRSLVFWRIEYAGDARSIVRMHAVSRTTGRTRTGFAAVHIVYDPRARTFRSPDPGGQDYQAVVVGAGNRIYVGHVLGDPNSVWPRSRIEVLSATTGRTVAAYDLPLPGYLTSLALRGDTLYAGGSFRRFLDGRPAHLATLALDPRDGALDSSFDAHTHGPVYGLAATRRRVYITGIFDRAWPYQRVDAVAVDPQSGAVDPRFRVRTGSFEPDYVMFGSPVALGSRLLNVPTYYYPYAVNLVDPLSGRRVALPGGSAALNALLPVGRRYYVDADQELPFENFTGSDRHLAGLTP